VTRHDGEELLAGNVGGAVRIGDTVRRPTGPSNPLAELAFIAWNCVPLWRDLDPGLAARRLTLIAAGYGGVPPRQILHAVPGRIRVMLDGIPAAAAAGDQGMANLMTKGEPEQSRVSLAGLVGRIPAIDRALP
jgi:hypothetical protein